MMINCPEFLDDEGRREWFNMAPSVFAIVGRSTETAEKLGRYIALHLEWRRLYVRVKELGEWRTTRKGWRFTPEYVAMNKASRRMHAVGEQLGCSPLARAKIRARRDRANTPHRPRSA